MSVLFVLLCVIYRGVLLLHILAMPLIMRMDVHECAFMLSHHTITIITTITIIPLLMAVRHYVAVRQAPTMTSVQALQKKRLSAALHSTTWSVLILDSTTFPLINTLFRMIELRHLNITTVLRIEDVRDRVHAMAVYFVHSSSLPRVVADITGEVYAQYMLNFVDSVERTGLEEMAMALSARGLAHRVVHVWDRHLNFMALDDHLFVVGRDAVSGLFSLFFTVENVPFIVYDHGDKDGRTGTGMDADTYTDTYADTYTDADTEMTGGVHTASQSIGGTHTASQSTVHGRSQASSHADVVNRLYNKLRNNAIRKGVRRPLLIIFRRDTDMFTPIEHAWSYAGLMHDVLGMHMNTVQYRRDGRTCTYTATPDDAFFMANKYEAFPVVTERIEKEHLAYKRRRTAGVRTSDVNELARLNEMIDVHMCVCLDIVDRVSECGYDEYRMAERRRMGEEEVYKVIERGDTTSVKRLLCAMIRRGDRPEVVEGVARRAGIDRTYVDRVCAYVQAMQAPTTLYRRASDMLSRLVGSEKDTPLSAYVKDVLAQARRGELRVMGNRKVCHEEIDGVYVYVMGGGCYREVESVREMGVVYGCDEMVDGKTMVERIG